MANKSFISVLTELGLTTGLELCLDAGDADSYDPAVQTEKWLDVSGNGHDFWKGAGSGATGSDPTFNGTAGNKSSSEYWSFDGGDIFRYDTTNEAWMNNIHKAGAKFTLAAWMVMGDVTAGATRNLAGTVGSTGTGTGFAWTRSSTGAAVVFNVYNGSGTILSKSDSGATAFDGGTLNFHAVSMDEAAGDAFFQKNDAFTTISSPGYVSPSSSSASEPMEIGARGGGQSQLPNGSQMSGFFAWSRALGQDELLEFRQASIHRFVSGQAARAANHYRRLRAA